MVLVSKIVLQRRKMKENKEKIQESPLFWPARFERNILLVLDETQLPQKLHYIQVKTTDEAVEVIRQMKTRAFGQFLVVLNTFLLERSLKGRILGKEETKQLIFII